MALNLIHSWRDDFRSFHQPGPNRRDETGSALSLFMPLEAKKDIIPHVRRLPDLGVLQPMQLACNMPLLPIKKSHTNDYRPLQ